MRERNRRRGLPEPEHGPGHDAHANGGASWPDFWLDSREQGRPHAGAPRAPRTSGAATQSGPPPPPAASRTVGPLEAFVRRPLLTLLPILLLVIVAVYVGVARSPVYTAKARVNVGRTDVAPYVLQSVIGGSQALAVSYSRVISTASVVRAAGREAGTGPQAAADRLSASPVPGSTLIQVEATGPRSADAVSLANAGSRALINYVEKATRDTTSNGALNRFRAAQADMTRAQRKVDSLRGQGPGSASDLAQADVDLEAAKLRASNLANVYRASAADPTSGSPLTLISPAASASSDFASTMERLVLLGVAAGLVLGLGLALVAANRGRLRAMRE